MYPYIRTHTDISIHIHTTCHQAVFRSTLELQKPKQNNTRHKFPSASHPQCSPSPFVSVYFFKSRISSHELAQPAYLAVSRHLSHLLYLISFSIQVTNSLPPLAPPPLAHCSPSPFVSILLYLFYFISNSSHKISSSSQSASLQPIVFYACFIVKRSRASLQELPSARILFTVAHRVLCAFSFVSVSLQVTTFLHPVCLTIDIQSQQQATQRKTQVQSNICMYIYIYIGICIYNYI